MMKATTAAGMSIRIKRIRKIMINPIIIKAISPKISLVGKGKLNADSLHLCCFLKVAKITIAKANSVLLEIKC